jgi:zinc/manganese transport system substrate-binding protein
MIRFLSILLVALAAGWASPTVSAQPIPAIAAENMWGSILAQLGGDRVTVTSIISDPNADPHEYESSVTTARAFADARYIVLNGAGYDAWAQKLVDGNPASRRLVLSVADELNMPPGANAHFWYNPTFVERIADRMTVDLSRIDPGGNRYYRDRRLLFHRSLTPYYDRIRAIRAAYRGTRVGATESIFVYLATALDLRLISPPPYMQAVANGTEPPVASVVEMERQLTQRQVRLLAYNTQTVTSVTTNAKRIAQTHNVPVVGISETIVPARARFQDWQSAQLDSIRSALARR